MRVATSTFSSNFIDQLNRLVDRQNRLQAQAASGQKVTLPEDDPGAVQEVLNLQATASANTQYQQNISNLQETATATYNVISGLKTISDRASEIAVQAGGINSPADLANYATEVSGLIKQAIQVANTQDQGNYLLAGTKSNTPPFVATTDANGVVTGVTYQGNTSVASSEIAPGTTVSAQTLGANTTGSGPRGLITDSRSGADFLNHLISLQNDLTSGNTAAITSTDTPQLAKDEDNILYQVAANGALQTRLETTNNLSTQQNQTVSDQISGDTSADLADTLTQLSQAQNAYQAALSSGAKIMNTSLMDYLH